MRGWVVFGVMIGLMWLCYGADEIVHHAASYAHEHDTYDLEDKIQVLRDILVEPGTKARVNEVLKSKEIVPFEELSPNLRALREEMKEGEKVAEKLKEEVEKLQNNALSTSVSYERLEKQLVEATSSERASKQRMETLKKEYDVQQDSYQLEKVQLKKLVEKVQGMLVSLDLHIKSIKQIKNPKLEAWFVKQAKELGSYLDSELTADLLQSSVDFASSTYNSTGDILLSISDTLPQSNHGQRFLKTFFGLIFASLFSLGLVLVISRLNSRKLAFLSSWVLALASWVALIVARRDLDAHRASPQLLAVQVLMLSAAWVMLISLPICAVQTTDRTERHAFVAEIIVTLTNVSAYRRYIMQYSLQGMKLEHSFLVGCVLSAIAASALAAVTTVIIYRLPAGKTPDEPVSSQV